MRIWTRGGGGSINVRGASGGDEEELSLQMLTPVFERWHYVEVERVDNLLRVSVDDMFTKTLSVNSDISDNLPSEELTLVIGKSESGGSFVGCVGDVIVNGELISFSQVERTI